MSKIVALMGLVLMLAAATEAGAVERVYKAPLSKLNVKQLKREQRHSQAVVRFVERHPVGRYASAFRHRTCFTVVRVRRGRCFYVRNQERFHEALAARIARMLTPPAPSYSSPAAAICAVFGAYCSQALAVARCESGLSVYAQNGQYLGLFQMGEYARGRYGHSYSALGQAQAAFAYFRDSGYSWGPWECKP